MILNKRYIDDFSTEVTLAYFDNNCIYLGYSLSIKRDTMLLNVMKYKYNKITNKHRFDFYKDKCNNIYFNKTVLEIKNFYVSSTPQLWFNEKKY